MTLYTVAPRLDDLLLGGFHVILQSIQQPFVGRLVHTHALHQPFGLLAPGGGAEAQRGRVGQVAIDLRCLVNAKFREPLIERRLCLWRHFATVKSVQQIGQLGKAGSDFK